jgi:anti-sigma factor RsiW
MENIEAMLCAYIEGDLDEAGRAQIEKHLQEHPQHRKLIAALTATRDLMRDLPRAKAPADVGEWLHGQVERSILLDDSDLKATAQRAKPSRWPQLLGVAAVLLLFAALGIIVMKMVMPTFTPPVSPTAATIRMPAPSPAETENAASDQTKTNDAAAQQSLRDYVSKFAAAQPLPAVQLDVEAVRRRLQNSGYAVNTNGNAQTPSVLLVINSSDRSTTEGQITQYLNSQNGISWLRVPDESAKSPVQALQLNQLAGAQNQNLAASPPPEQASTTQPAAPTASANYELKDQAEIEASALKTAEKNPSSNFLAPPTTQPAIDMYVAQGMTIQQADALRQSLVSQPNVQAAQIYRETALEVPTTQPGANSNLVLSAQQESLKPMIPADQLVVNGGTTPTTTEPTAPTTAPALAYTTNLSANASAGLGGKFGGVGGGGTNTQMAVSNVVAVIVVQPAGPPAPQVAGTPAAPPAAAPSTEPATTLPSPSTQP